MFSLGIDYRGGIEMGKIDWHVERIHWYATGIRTEKLYEQSLRIEKSTKRGRPRFYRVFRRLRKLFKR